jgi:hypothetical protein
VKEIWVRAYFVKENEVPLWLMDGGGTMLIPHFFGGIMGVVRSIVKRTMMYLCVLGIERKECLSKESGDINVFFPISFFFLFKSNELSHV